MKFTRVAMIVLSVVLLAADAGAFDYQRKGFVIGVGSGYSPLMTMSEDELGFESDDQSGFAGTFVIGYAWNNQNMALIRSTLGSYVDMLYIYDDGIVVGGNEIRYAQGFWGLAYRHHFSPADRSIFADVGFGYQIWAPSEIYFVRDGIGFLVGGGYEFTKHFQIEASYSFGFVASCGGSESDHSQIVFALTGLLY